MASPSLSSSSSSLSSILDGTLGKIGSSGKNVADALKVLDGKLINSATDAKQWRRFQTCFEEQIAKFTDTDGIDDEVAHVNKKTKHSKEVLMSAAWEAYQSSRKSIAKQLRKEGERLQSNGLERSAHQILQESVQIYPCDSISRLKLAERQRDMGEIENYERTLRDCITVTGLTATKEKEVSAGWSAMSLLALLLCQLDRDSEARTCLLLLGFQYRLSPCLLHYNFSRSNNEVVVPESSGVVVLDSALEPLLLKAAYQAFNPTSPFWFEHKYHNPCTGYFSYVMPLKSDSESDNEMHSEIGLMDKIVKAAKELARDKFPEVDSCEQAEWWAHCRCHASGHQMHFDSAFEVLYSLSLFSFYVICIN